MVYVSYRKALESERTAILNIELAIHHVEQASRFTSTEYRKQNLGAIAILLNGIKTDIEENEFQTIRGDD